MALIKCKNKSIYRLTLSLWLNIVFHLMIMSQIMAIIVSNQPSFVNGDQDDWLQCTAPCRCKWNSGKKTADCKNNSLKEIPIDMNSELQVLDLSDNLISEIRREEFNNAGLQNLHKIFMRNCTLQEINRDGLRELKVLIELDFSSNMLTTLQAGTFTGLDKLRQVYLNRNRIAVLDDYLFENLVHLMKVELRENLIYQIGPRTFVNLPRISEINLDSNRLTVLKEDTFISLSHLVSLSIRQNPWNCTCELQKFHKFIIDKKYYTDPTTCDQPSKLRGKLWTEIPTENFACRPHIITPKAGTAIDASMENVTLTCRIRANPRPKVGWLFNKRPINHNDHRLHVKDSQETNRRDSQDILTSELIIVGVRSSDRGTYVCLATNNAGTAEAEIQLAVSQSMVGGFLNGVTGGGGNSNGLHFYPIILTCVIIIIILIMLIVMIGWCYYRRYRRFSKNTGSDTGLVLSGTIGQSSKGGDKLMMNGGGIGGGSGDAMLNGSVMEMQKSLLTEVNPVEKPPRRNELDSLDYADDGKDLKRTLLDETTLGSHEEVHSIALSESIPGNRQTYIDDGHGGRQILPPDLLAFSGRFPQSPSLRSSISNIHDGQHYIIKSPLGSPIYQHNTQQQQSIPPTGMYGVGPTSAGFRTLQHPKTGRTMSITSMGSGSGPPVTTNIRGQSPFQPAPIMYAPIVMKQGYVTIPRKQRTPSWAPSISSNMTLLAGDTSGYTSALNGSSPVSPTSSQMDQITTEPVYDNLGLRTTASGNSVINLSKLGTSTGAQPVTMKMVTGANESYTMKDRPLPATPQPQLLYGGGTIMTDSIHSIGDSSLNPLLKQSNTSIHNTDTDALYTKSTRTPSVVSTSGKIPPRPPPKPKKKTGSSGGLLSGMISNGGHQQLFEDEGEDGTEI